MKLYTKRGDEGDTDLFGGKRIAKDSLRIEAFGTVDELNSAVGLAAAACKAAELAPILRTVQERLFELGADLATPRKAADDQSSPGGSGGSGDSGGSGGAGGVPRISTDQISEAERFIDQVFAPLPPMRNFILPGGCELAARLHLARTVCRRAERLCFALARLEPVGEPVTIYLNRLSDLLFAMARRANQLEGMEDVPWMGKR